MSAEGIKKAAAVFAIIQDARMDLIRMGGKPGGIDKQDILLGQMFGKANDAVKDDFMRLTMGKTPKSR